MSSLINKLNFTFCNKLPVVIDEAIDINLLMINPNLAIVQERNFSDLSELLKPYDIECIPVRIRHDRLFAGGHHCTTLDIRRRGSLENYFD